MSCAMLALPNLPVVRPVAREVWEKPSSALQLASCRRAAFGGGILKLHACRSPLVRRGVPPPPPSPRVSCLLHLTTVPTSQPSFSCAKRTALSLPVRFSERSKTQKKRAGVVLHAVPTVVSGAVAAVVVVASVAILLARGVGKEQVEEEVKATKLPCEACQGSGVCGTCQGEGFVAKNLSPEAQARAKARSPTAATRNTAMLARKWNYCPDCGGGRACRPCDGRGSLNSTL
eukprot:TRINITY_DN4897_c0_g1_i1.p1 TRINITY_DN4897_c0_g1~~TRINITY_DN4897_c0_g1_i1.p1  ORF type:complete len:231 (+),score=14.60 TRINITY_DN4897_c0_g1_i1:189-881(+)